MCTQIRSLGTLKRSVLLSVAVSCATANAANIYSSEDVKIRFDNTVKYSAAYRLKSQSSDLTNTFLNILDDGNRNFDRGLVSNRVDLLSEFDLVYKNRMGIRVSGAAWYDDVYNQGNDNDSDAAVNTTSVPAGRFSDDTRDEMGRDAEILDAFLFLKNDPYSNTPYSVRAGRHTVVYGESLFFGANGIANAQAPIDLIKLLSVPGSQFKEIIRPVGQVSTQIQLTPKVSFGAYYQFEWDEARLPASGSYLSDVDIVGAGAEWLVPGAIPVRSGEASDNGQFGAQFRFRPGKGSVEYGLYAAQYHDKLPQLYLDVTNNELNHLYIEDVKTAGASFSTVLGDANVAGELSYRWDAPLVSDLVAAPEGANGTSNQVHAIGESLHAQLSAIYLMSENPLWDGAEFLGEVAWNTRMDITDNPEALDPNTTKSAAALRYLFTPQYFQVAPGLDLSLPIGVGYNFYGRSSTVFKYNGGTEHAGDFSLGLNFDYKRKVKGGISYTHYFGDEEPFLDDTGTMTFGQSLADRDFISLNIRTTF
ncbi:hypothetical protein MARLIPOL_12595 [Marinobacter lipolyticus SM19]|uniref:DUF1302 domain-containing protein n=1 Tax=Marinobacter lipolyticus SM19 TaxID=1318628 RepID=R8AZN1_9GAMM|nr:hypothetical protein MARLIPOL_12595 [Marinobacter lipolyticus SM19]